MEIISLIRIGKKDLDFISVFNSISCSMVVTDCTEADNPIIFVNQLTIHQF